MSTKKGNPHSKFFALLASMPGASKEDLVWEYSHKLTSSLSELLEKHPNDYRRMIVDMQQLVGSVSRTNNNAVRLMIEKELKAKRSSILLRLQKIGVDTTDWDIVNKYMRSPKIAGKTLGEMDAEEMDALIPKLESILSKKKADTMVKLTNIVFSLN